MTNRRGRRATAFILLAGGWFGAPSEAQEAIDMKLADAGFTMRPANTPQKMERLKLLPPRRIVAHIKNGKPYYIYADPDYCRCAMIGDAIAMQQYRDMGGSPAMSPPGPQGQSPEMQVIEQMSADGGSLAPDDIFSAPF